MPASTSMVESMQAGKAANEKCVTWPMLVSRAMAPPGGCRQRPANITAMAKPTAAAEAQAGSGIRLAQVMPTSADSVLPPTTDQGCASGLPGTANTSTALAPNGAASQGRVLLLSQAPWPQRHSRAVNRMPMKPPSAARQRSR